jgi:hypothetical protein
MSYYFVLWHGLGWLALVFLGGFYALFDAVLPLSSQHLSAALAYVCSAPPCWFLGKYLRAHYTRMVKDKETGKKIRVRQPKHGLFFIPMHWLGVVFLVVGVGLVIDEAGKSQPPPHVALREAEPPSARTSNWVTFSPPSGDFHRE